MHIAFIALFSIVYGVQYKSPNDVQASGKFKYARVFRYVHMYVQ